jgi:tight adherence protein B
VTELAYWSGRTGALCLALGGVAFVYVLFTTPGRLQRALAARRDFLDRELRFLRVRLGAEQLLVVQGLALAASVALALAGRPLPAVAIALVALFSVGMWLARERDRRVTQLEGQLESWLTLVAGSLDGSPSLGEALRTTGQLVEPPLADEIAQVLAEHQLGSPLDRALDASARRVRGRTFSTALLTLRIGRNTGGSLQQLLRETASNLREMARLEGVVRTKTAEGKAQAAVVSVMPAPLYLCLRTMNPDFFAPLETTSRGHVIVGVACVLWLGAALLARRILAVDT